MHTTYWGCLAEIEELAAGWIVMNPDKRGESKGHDIGNSADQAQNWIPGLSVRARAACLQKGVGDGGVVPGPPQLSPGCSEACPRRGAWGEPDEAHG